MSNLNKKHFVIILIMFFIFVHKANANVLINEVQISPTENRFIELYNNGSDPVNLTDWYIQRKTATGSTYGSLVSKTYFENKTIEPNGYFVISKVNLSSSNIVYDSLTLTESNSIQIKNSESVVVDKVGWGESNDCGGVCAPNPTDGKSISRTSSGSFIVTSSTPGLLNNESENINENTDTVNNTNTTDSNTTSGSSTSGTSGSIMPKVVLETFKISTKIVSPKIVTAGIPFLIDHMTTGIRKEKIVSGKFVWNFGDGMKKEMPASLPFEYSYQYPGDYVLSLSYYSSYLNEKPDAVDRITMKVVPSGIIVSSIGSSLDPYIEIENNSNYEISLNDWILRGGSHVFMFPDDMVILPNKKLKLSPKITGFDINDLSSISIFDKSGQIFAVYPRQNIAPVVNYVNKKPVVDNVSKQNTTENNQIDNSDNIVNLNDLAANASNTGNLNIFKNNFYPWLGLGSVIFIGAASVIILRRKGREYQDYAEGELSAKDMTIIE
ncbi:MAG: lamin tail domain-containing protein [Candidatus Nomurabacteria bacterium]